MAGRVFLKDGVDLTDMAPAGVLILGAIKGAARSLKVDLTVTCGREGHPQTDPHSLGEGIDLRSHDLDPDLRSKVLDAVLYAIGRERFFGFLEDPGTANEHFHYQRRKNTTFNLEDWLRA